MVITTGSTGLAFAASFAFAIDAVARTRFGRAGARGFSILKHVDAGMTAGQFVTKATCALFLWPKELLDTELNRKALAYTLRHDLFAGNPDGWTAFSKAMRAKVSWFGDGVPDLAKPDTEGDDKSAAPAGAVSQQADDAGTGKPLWPWSEDNPPPA
jgi:hypothetical protein